MHLTKELQGALKDCATRQDRSIDELIHDAVVEYLARDTAFADAVRRGEAELKDGASLTHDQVGQRLERFLRP